MSYSICMSSFPFKTKVLSLDQSFLVSQYRPCKDFNKGGE